MLSIITPMTSMHLYSGLSDSLRIIMIKLRIQREMDGEMELNTVVTHQDAWMSSSLPWFRQRNKKNKL